MPKQNNNIIISKQRVKEYGEVYTESNLVNEILDKLPINIFISNLRFLEPTCGNGNFLKEILKRKVLYNHNIIDSLKNIYGIDIMNDNVLTSRKNLFSAAIELGLKKEDWENAILIIKKNIKQGNTLEIDIESFFEE